MLVEVQGDLLDTPCRYIAHGVNCKGVMKSGIAKALSDRWPQVKESYHEWFVNRGFSEYGYKDSDYLGLIDFVKCDDKTILSLFIQENYGYDGKLYLSYEALESCFKDIVRSNIKEIAIPKIGCGLAGGDWEKVKSIINEVTKDSVKVIVYVK